MVNSMIVKWYYGTLLLWTHTLHRKKKIRIVRKIYTLILKTYFKQKSNQLLFFVFSYREVLVARTAVHCWPYTSECCAISAAWSCRSTHLLLFQRKKVKISLLLLLESAKTRSTGDASQRWTPRARVLTTLRTSERQGCIHGSLLQTHKARQSDDGPLLRCF